MSENLEQVKATQEFHDVYLLVPLMLGGMCTRKYVRACLCMCVCMYVSLL